MRIYLAGPFFNKESKEVVQMLRDKLEQLGHNVWSPMHDGITCPKNADRRMRQKVFHLDCERLHRVDCVVALLDYPLPIHQQLFLRTRTPEGISNDTPVSFPDSGTVFEIGYFNGLRETGLLDYGYIIGYTRTSGFNLMVTEACDCVVSDLTQLQRAMEFVAVQDDDALLLLKIQYAQGDLKEI